MEKPRHLIGVCASFRADGTPQGACHRKGAGGLLPYVENEILERGLDAQVISTGCLKACEHGPVMVIYPEGHWYGGVDGEAIIDAILDALEEGRALEDRLII